MPRKRPDDPAASLSEQVRAIILRRALVPHRLARAAAVQPSVVTRFLNRDVDYVTGPTLDKLASALGLHLAEGRGGLR